MRFQYLFLFIWVEFFCEPAAAKLKCFFSRRMYSTRNNDCWFRFIVFSFDLCDCLSFVRHWQTITTASTNQGSLPDSRQFLCNQKFCSWATDISSANLSQCSGGFRGRVRGSRPPYQTLRLFETEILTSTGSSYIIF